MAKKPDADNSVCRNRKATFQFAILEKLECGIVLHGAEVKSLRAGNVSLNEAYARIDGNELYLIGFHIGQYAFDTSPDRESRRRLKLLAHSREIHKLRVKVEQKGLTLVPLRVYFNSRGIAKVEVAVARGKSAGDKRQGMKDREHKREMDRYARRRR